MNAPNELPLMDRPRLSAASLGSAGFRRRYGLKYAYLAGAMYKGIASKELVVAMSRVGCMGFLGSGGLKLARLESDIRWIQQQLPAGAPYGINLITPAGEGQLERRIVDLFLRLGVRHVEAAAYMQVTPQLVRYRLHGARRLPSGALELPNHVMAKVSRPEVAAAFMAPPPPEMVEQLLAEGQISSEEAALAPLLPVAGELCIESDSGGHTDQGVALVLFPAMRLLRDGLCRTHAYTQPVYLGTAGGIGTPEAIAACLLMRADFVMTGSINQCTPEAGTSDAVKDMLAAADVQDTGYAPAGDMFELGARVQVLRRGLFFPARANKLFELYGRHGSIEELDAKMRQQIETRYFKRSIEEVWQETRRYYMETGQKTAAELDHSPKQKLALIFRWYFIHTTRLALAGSGDQRVDYQVHCGPAMGAFNQWVKGTDLEPWRQRAVGLIALRLMDAAAELLNERLQELQQAALQAME
jgi:trans-AT polyketide synthase, acyltransferase and oxidoreductase domains